MILFKRPECIMAATGNYCFRAAEKNGLQVVCHMTITNNDSAVLVESVTVSVYSERGKCGSVVNSC